MKTKGGVELGKITNKERVRDELSLACTIAENLEVNRFMVFAGLCL
jgi:hypothetical protein